MRSSSAPCWPYLSSTWPSGRIPAFPAAVWLAHNGPPPATTATLAARRPRYRRIAGVQQMSMPLATALSGKKIASQRLRRTRACSTAACKSGCVSRLGALAAGGRRTALLLGSNLSSEHRLIVDRAGRCGIAGVAIVPRVHTRTAWTPRWARAGCCSKAYLMPALGCPATICTSFWRRKRTNSMPSCSPAATRFHCSSPKPPMSSMAASSSVARTRSRPRCPHLRFGCPPSEAHPTIAPLCCCRRRAARQLPAEAKGDG